MSAKFSRNVLFVIRRQSILRRNSSTVIDLKPYNEIPGRQNLLLGLIRPPLNPRHFFLVTDQSLSINRFFSLTSQRFSSKKSNIWHIYGNHDRNYW